MEYISQICRQLSASNSSETDDLMASIDIGRLAQSALVSLDELKTSSPLSKSFHHPGGALKIILYSEGRDHPELRIHIWRHGKHVEQDNNLESVHDHKWTFYSRILHGYFRHAVFEERRDEGMHVSRYCFESPGSGTYRTSGPQDGRIVLVADDLLRAGQRYFLKSGALHSFVPTDDCYSATLFYRLHYERDKSIVFLDESNAKVIPDTSGPRFAATSDIRRELFQLIDMSKSLPNEHNR